MSFLDSTVTPHRVLKLFDFLRSRSDKSFETRDLKRVFQPTALENVTDQSDQIGDAVRSCIGLGLAARDTARTVKSVDASPEKSSKMLLIEAFDRIVLESTESEEWFAKFYAYIIARDKEVKEGSNDVWEVSFNRDLFGENKPRNRLNQVKINAFRRWYAFIGLGWFDHQNTFRPNPKQRIERHLPAMFHGSNELSSDEFISALSDFCPELDGGTIFNEVKPTTYDPQRKQLSIAVASAVRDLEVDNIISIDFSRDSSGWDLKKGAVSGNTKFDAVRFNA